MGSEPTLENEARKQADVKRVYRNQRIAVHWEPKFCNHTARLSIRMVLFTKPRQKRKSTSANIIDNYGVG